MQVTAGVCLLSCAGASQETSVSYTFQKVDGLMVIPVFCWSKARRCHSHCPGLPILVEISGNSCNESQAMGEFKKAFTNVDRSPRGGPGLSEERF